MALNTRNQLASSMGLSLPWRGLYPIPDVTINKWDMEMIVGLYRFGEPIAHVPAKLESGVSFSGEITGYPRETYGLVEGELGFAGEIKAIEKILARLREGELTLVGDIPAIGKVLTRTEQGELNLSGGMPPSEIEISVEIVSGHGASGEIRLDKRQDIDDILDIVTLVMGYGGYDEMY